MNKHEPTHIWKEVRREQIGSHIDWGERPSDITTVYRVAIHEKCLLTKQTRIREENSLFPLKNTFAKVLGERLREDEKNNDHYTGWPMFCLQILVRDTGYDLSYSDNKCWWNTQELQIIYDDDSPEIKEIYEFNEDNDNWEGPFGYKDRWETVMVAFTQEGLDDYMRQDGHNVKRRAFRGQTRTYVESFYRCDEMIKVREFLMEY